MNPSSLLATGLFLGLAAPGLFAQGLVATVNDPLSHGQPNDSFLSLDEAIRVANGTLSMASLSAAEQAQITGTGMNVLTIRVMAMNTPTITLQAPLTDVMGGGMMAGRLTIMGMGSAMVPRPTLLGGTETHILALRTHLVTVMGMRFDGGQVAVDAQTPAMMGMPMTEMARLMNCELDGQTTAGVHLHGSGGDESMLMTMNSRLSNMPVGYRLDDQTTGTGMVMSENEFITMDNVTLGADVQDDGNGVMSMFMLFRSQYAQGQTLARMRRTASSANQFMFRIVHTDAVCTGDVLDLQGTANGLTMLHHHHGDFTAGAGGKTVWTYPRTAVFDVHGSEMVFHGDVYISGNVFSPRVWQQNNRYVNGTITYDCDGALPNLLWNVYENSQLVVPSSARSPVTVRSSELYNTTVDCQSLFAATAVNGSYRVGGAVTGFATENTPAPSQFLGTATIGPVDPQIGGTLQLHADMPYGIGCFWDFAFSYSRPTTTAEP
ncbi:MAG: hypothetical protein KDC48_14945, partial [Planctomycetes bacterium]|nr:hypothetical protein [Planctomycetota bacterium]